MARYRAIASGAWETLSIWEDNSGGSYAASSILPSSNDEVYCNGFGINVNGTYSVKSVSNGIPDDQDENTPANDVIISGGYLQMTNDSNKTLTLTADVYNYSSQIIYCALTGNRVHTINITGNCYNYANSFINASSGVNSRAVRTTIVGNVFSLGNIFQANNGTGSSSGWLLITGNVDANSSELVSNTGSNSAYLVINGDVKKNGGSFTSGGNRTINGSFYATSIFTQSIEITNGEIINAFWLSAGYTASNISKYRVIIDNVEWFLPEEITNGLPSASDVRQGVQFGLNNEFLGTLDLPQEANVQVGVVYDNGNKTGTYNVSISPADIIAALATYGTAKSSDLSGMSTLTLADIATALSNYGTAKASDLSGLSTLTSNDILQALAAYTAVKVSDLSGISISQQDVVDALATYGASKVSDLSSALNTYGAAKSSEIENVVKEEYLSEILGE